MIKNIILVGSILFSVSCLTFSQNGELSEAELKALDQQECTRSRNATNIKSTRVKEIPETVEVQADRRAADQAKVKADRDAKIKRSLRKHHAPGLSDEAMAQREATQPVGQSPDDHMQNVDREEVLPPDPNITQSGNDGSEKAVGQSPGSELPTNIPDYRQVTSSMKQEISKSQEVLYDYRDQTPATSSLGQSEESQEEAPVDPQLSENQLRSGAAPSSLDGDRKEVTPANAQAGNIVKSSALSQRTTQKKARTISKASQGSMNTPMVPGDRKEVKPPGNTPR